MEKMLDFLKENKRLFIVAFAFVGFVCLAISVGNVLEENKVKIEAVSKWYMQLPENHCIKQENKNSILVMDLFHGLVGTYESVNEITYLSLQEEENMLVQFFGKCMETSIKTAKKAYHLQNANTHENIRRIKLCESEHMKLCFWYNDIPLMLEFIFEEYMAEMERIAKSEKLTIANKIVYSYVDDPSVAVVQYGEIVGIKKGNTKLHLFCNGFHFEYDIKVRN